MNVVKIYGGLGNQLFQYAFGKVMEVNGIEVRYDLSWFKRKQAFPRPYMLDKFCIEVKTSPFLKQKTIRENGFNFDLLRKTNCNFNGYWQYMSYYSKIIPFLKKEFCVKNELLTKEYFDLRAQIICNNSVTLHVRRGDLLVNERDYAQELGYYKGAIKQMKSLQKKCKIFIFSDDIEWCKEHFKDVTFVSLIDYLDFELQKLCKHNIISNSTFSWWTSVLNTNESKIIIAPKMWRSDPKDQVKFEEGLYLKNWILL